MINNGKKADISARIIKFPDKISGRLAPPPANF